MRYIESRRCSARIKYILFLGDFSDQGFCTDLENKYMHPPPVFVNCSCDNSGELSVDTSQHIIGMSHSTELGIQLPSEKTKNFQNYLSNGISKPDT